ncbi:MAG: divergent PAP2 family protein [Spirochaetales bacterium]|nr:divergent PAP2 family protein [Spirochaetales bacterium]
MEYIRELFLNKIFLSAIFSWFIAQVMKSVVEIVKNRPRSAVKILTYMFWATGGMPSSHSSVVTAIAAGIGFVNGVGDPLFAVTLFYALLVIRDAMGVRRSTGLQAQTINRILSVIDTERKIKPVKEIHGHSTAEVSVGILLGFFIAAAFCNL